MNSSTMIYSTGRDRALIGNAHENRGRFGDGSGTAAGAGRSPAAKRRRAYSILIKIAMMMASLTHAELFLTSLL